LPLGTYLRFIPVNRSEHVAQQAASGIAGIDVLIEHLEVDPFTGKFLGNFMPSKPKRSTFWPCVFIASLQGYCTEFALMLRIFTSK
jgi:hypothetical protein